MPSKTTSTFAAFHGIVVCESVWSFCWVFCGFLFFFVRMLPARRICESFAPAEGRGARAFDPTCLHQVGGCGVVHSDMGQVSVRRFTFGTG